MDRNILILLIALGLMILYRRRARLRSFFRENSMVYSFFLYALLSISWADYQTVSIKRWIRAVGDVIMVLAILTEESQREAIERVFRRCIIVLVPLSLLFIKYYRAFGVSYTEDGLEMWTGVTVHKNSLGELCAFSCVFLIWRAVKNWPAINLLDVALMVLGTYLLVGSHSATSMIVFLVGILILLGAIHFKGRRKKTNRFILISLISILIFQGILVVFFDSPAIRLVAKAAGRDESFTGRVPLWQELIKSGSQKPLLGSGYGSFWVGNLTHHLWDLFAWKPLSGHNGYIDVFMDLGLVGLILMFLLIISSYRRILDSLAEDKDIGNLKIAFFIMILLHNVMETSLAQPTDFLWFIFLLSSMSVIKKENDRDLSSPVASETTNFSERSALDQNGA